MLFRSNYEGDEVDHEDGDGYGDGDGAGLDGGVDGDSGGGMEEPSGGDFGGVSPSDLLRQQLSVSFSWFLCFSTASLRNSSGDYFYSRF